VSPAGPRPRESAALWIVGAIAVVLIASLWLGLRWVAEVRRERGAFPVESGRITVQGLSAPVEIARDARGVPHIRSLGAAEADAWYGAGFAHAQDRLAQMLWLRRLARGRSAEVVGSSGLPADRLSRVLGLGHSADERAQHLPASTRRALEAYARGVNERIGRVERGRVARPVGLEGWPPLEPWRPADSLAVAKLVAWASTGSIETGLVLSDLIERLGGLGARPFFPVSSGIQGLSIPFEPEPPALESAPLRDEAAASEQVLRVAALGGTAWVVAGDRTRSGAPLLAAELEASATLPALFYELSLRAGDWQVRGVTIPGVPVLWAGRSRDVAWASAPAGAVTTDLFVETLRPGDPSRYHDGLRWARMRERVELIGVRRPDGGVEQERLVVRSTVHGPVVSDLLDPEREPLSLSWTGGRGGGITSLLRVARASRADDVVRALRDHHDPVMALAYADREGAGGVQIAGWLPRRVLPTSLVPVPGRMRAFHWREGVDFEALPAERLEEGRAWVIASDQPWIKGPERETVEWLWRSGERSARIEALLREALARGPLDVAAAVAVQTDRVVPGAEDLVPALLGFARQGEALGPEASEIAAALAGWDRRAEADSAGAATYHLLLDHLVRELFGEALGEPLLLRYRELPRASAERIAAAAVVGAAGGAPGSWSDPARVGPALRRSLRQTWASLTFRLGSSRERWSWGRLHQLLLQPLPDGPGTAGRGLEPLPIGGDESTVFLAATDPRQPFQVMRAATYRMAVDLSQPQGEAEGFWSALAPGQSEHPGHAHYADGLGPWLRGDLPPAEEARAAAEVDDGGDLLVLEPAP
jgi:penicillin amidase